MKITIEWDDYLDETQIGGLVSEIRHAFAPFGDAIPDIMIEQPEPTSLGLEPTTYQSEPDDDRR